MYKIVIYIIGMLLFTAAVANGQVVVDEPEPIVKLSERIKAENREIDTDSGWRIQILATTERRKMDLETVLFEKRFPELKRTEKYKKPYYSILTGARKERMELYPLLQKIQRHYPSAFIVKDAEIPKEEFLSI